MEPEQLKDYIAHRHSGSRPLYDNPPEAFASGSTAAETIAVTVIEEPKPAAVIAKVPFTKCLVHETKKGYIAAAKFWATLIVAVTATLAQLLIADAVLYIALQPTIAAGEAVLNALLALYQVLANAAGIMWAFLVSIPVWLDAVIVLAALPFLYALAVCTWRSYRDAVETAIAWVGTACIIYGLYAVPTAMYWWIRGTGTYPTGDALLGALGAILGYMFVIALIFGDHHGGY
jgi:hypothetical protein